MAERLKWTVSGMIIGVVLAVGILEGRRPTGRYQFAVVTGGGMITMDTRTGETWVNGPGLRTCIGKPWDNPSGPVQTTNRLQALLDASENQANAKD